MPKERVPHEARQQRSVVTRDRLCDAAEDALRTGGLACCTIQEVAARAGRSVGSVYRRFGDKDRMIVAVIERWLDRALAANEANFRRLADLHPDLEGRLRTLVAGAVSGQRRNWQLVKAFGEAADQSSNTELQASMMRMRAALFDLARAALRGCAAEIARPDKDAAVDFAVGMLGGAIDILMQQQRSAIDDAAFQSELHAMLHAYLTSGSGARTSRRRAGKPDR